MKEFSAQTGGRYTYVDDIINLQDLTLAFGSVFDDCDNFIISGCQVTGSSISAGYVYLNGKIRYCAGATGVSKWPMYIYESNSVDKVSYADSGDKVGRNIYACSLGSSVPTANDVLTGAAPKSISIASDGSAFRLKDAFFGKYALMVDSPYDSQVVNKKVTFTGDVTAETSVATKLLNVVSGTSKAAIAYEADGTLIISSTLSGKGAYKFIMTPEGVFKLMRGNQNYAEIGNSGATFYVSLSASFLYGGNMAIRSNHLYNTGATGDTASVNINMLGYNSGNNYYRDTYIGDGKNTAVLSIVGKTKDVGIAGTVSIGNSSAATLTLQHTTLAKTDKTLQSYVPWKDKNGDVMAQMGYTNASTYDWYVKNNIGKIVLDNDVTVTGTLIVNGTDVLGAMAKQSAMTDALALKANVSDVYSKTDADARYVKKTDSISQFVTNAGGTTAFCNLVGAASMADLDKAALKSQSFTDVVLYGLPSASDSTYASKLEQRKRQLCTTIGAAYSADITTEGKDTGWITMTVQNCGITTQLYVRQVGKVVSIQGRLHTHHSGTIFTLPNSIDPPKYEIGYSHNKDGNWHCTILGGSRDCNVDYCSNGCSEYIGFLMTYII